jgi:hypothetical protein
VHIADDIDRPLKHLPDRAVTHDYGFSRAPLSLAIAPSVVCTAFKPSRKS